MRSPQLSACSSATRRGIAVPKRALQRPPKLATGAAVPQQGWGELFRSVSLCAPFIPCHLQSRRQRRPSKPCPPPPRAARSPRGMSACRATRQVTQGRQREGGGLCHRGCCGSEELSWMSVETTTFWDGQGSFELCQNWGAASLGGVKEVRGCGTKGRGLVLGLGVSG